MADNSSAPYNAWQAITPSDTVDIPDFAPGLTLTLAVYVGADGNVVGVTQSGRTATFKGAKAGQILPLAVKRINSTSTTATDLVALYCV